MKQAVVVGVPTPIMTVETARNASLPVSMVENEDSSVLTPLATVYMLSEVIVAACSTIGNSLIVVSFLREAHLRTPTNMYVFSLAMADLLVSVVGIPIYLYSMMTSLPSDFLACLIVNTWIMMLCTVSIFHLVAVSYDRYLAVVWLRQPDSRKDRMRHAACSIAMAWICGTIVGFLPLMGWNRGPSSRHMCDFMEIMDMRYLMFLFYFTIITPTLLMAFFYVSIFHVVKRQDNRITRRSLRGSQSASESEREPTTFRLGSGNATSKETLLVSPSVRSRERHERLYYQSIDTHHKSDTHFSLTRSVSRVSSVQVLQDDIANSLSNIRRRLTTTRGASARKKVTKSRRVIFSFVLVILSFLVSWYPLYTLNAITYYAPQFRIDQAAFYACIVLSHLSTTVNPLIYARTMPGFKEVLLATLRCKRPVTRSRQSSFYLISSNNNSVNPKSDGPRS